MVGACKLATIGPAMVTGIVDAHTVTLDGGREARLSAIEVEAAAPLAREPSLAAATLRAVLDREVILRRLGPEQDRYGRLLVQLFVLDQGKERWIQADLLARGEARMAARVGDRGCARELLSAEKIARDAKLGLWAADDSGMIQAEDAGRLAKSRGHFALVEGKVVSVRESGNTIFVNFGRRWTEDFVVTVAKRNERAFATAGVAPFRLQGRRVRVRGVIEQRSGPWIEATRPEQIEVVESN